MTLISQCDMYYIINVLDFWVLKSKGEKNTPNKIQVLLSITKCNWVWSKTREDSSAQKNIFLFRNVCKASEQISTKYF